MTYDKVGTVADAPSLAVWSEYIYEYVKLLVINCVDLNEIKIKRFWWKTVCKHFISVQYIKNNFIVLDLTTQSFHEICKWEPLIRHRFRVLSVVFLK